MSDAKVNKELYALVDILRSIGWEDPCEWKLECLDAAIPAIRELLSPPASAEPSTDPVVGWGLVPEGWEISFDDDKYNIGLVEKSTQGRIWICHDGDSDERMVWRLLNAMLSAPSAPIAAQEAVAWPDGWVDQHVHPKTLHVPVMVPLEVLIRTEFELAHSVRGGDYDTKILGVLREIIAGADHTTAAKPITFLRLIRGQSWNGCGDCAAESWEKLATCNEGDIGADGKPAFPLYLAPSAPAVPAAGGVDCIGLALDLEGRAKTVESQTTERAMLDAAHGLRLLAAPAVPVGDGWIAVSERLPESGHKVLIAYRNSYDHDRRVCGFYAGKFNLEVPPGDDCDSADYNEASDTYYLDEGWYESIDNWPDYTSVTINSEVTHWQPLPASPAATKEEMSDGR